MLAPLFFLFFSPPAPPASAPIGPVAVAVDGLRTLIANIPFFQTWTGTTTADEALASVFPNELGYPIVAVSAAAGVLTVQTREPHQIIAGDTVTILGAALGPESAVNLDGQHTVISVTATTLTASTALSDFASVHPDQAIVLPPRPLAVVCEAENSLQSESIGTGGASINAGAVEILLEADVSSAYGNDPRNAIYEARNVFGSFVQGLMATQGTGDLMCLNKCETVQSPEFTAKAEQDDNTIRFERWRALLRVTWGLDG